MIETERLLLRPPALADFEPIAAMSADPSVSRFVGGKPSTREESWHRLLRYAGSWPLLGYGLFCAFEKAGGAFVGYAGLGLFERGLGARFDRDPEAAWALAAAHQGRGLATEAARAAHDWLEERLGIGRTVCIIDPDNGASLKVAAKLGYARFGEASYRDKSVLMLERSAGPRAGAAPRALPGAARAT